MASDASLKVLLIAPWVIKLYGMQASLHAQGLDPTIVRVDFEAALRAALMHHRFEAAFYAPTPTLSRDAAETCVRVHAPKLCIRHVEQLEQIGPELARLIASRRS